MLVFTHARIEDNIFFHLFVSCNNTCSKEIMKLFTINYAFKTYYTEFIPMFFKTVYYVGIAINTKQITKKCI